VSLGNFEPHKKSEQGKAFGCGTFPKPLSFETGEEVVLDVALATLNWAYVADLHTAQLAFTHWAVHMPNLAFKLRMGLGIKLNDVNAGYNVSSEMLRDVLASPVALQHLRDDVSRAVTHHFKLIRDGVDYIPSLASEVADLTSLTVYYKRRAVLDWQDMLGAAVTYWSSQFLYDMVYRANNFAETNGALNIWCDTIL